MLQYEKGNTARGTFKVHRKLFKLYHKISRFQSDTSFHNKEDGLNMFHIEDCTSYQYSYFNAKIMRSVCLFWLYDNMKWFDEWKITLYLADFMPKFR
jgi:hypothetical protein